MIDRITILFVEDDNIIASGLTYAFEAEGYGVIYCENARSAFEEIESREFDLAVLDLSLPDGSGFAICQRIKEKQNTPVVFLTAVDDEGNTVKGLEMGADDYITKPFRIRELIARLKAVLRRSGARSAGIPAQEGVLRLGGVKIDTLKGKVYKDGAEIILTALEYRLLLTFARNKGQILTRALLLEDMWDAAGSFVNDNTLTVYIKRLREKLNSGELPGTEEHEIIQTVRGVGYRAGEYDA